MSRRQAAAGSGTETTAQERGFFMFKSVFPPQRALVTITFEGEAIQVEEGTTVAAAVLDRAGGETRTTGAARTVTWASVTNASWRSTASQTSSPASSPCGKACR